MVNILSDDQEPVSRRFATERSVAAVVVEGGLGLRPGATGAPILDGVLAYAECRVYERVDAGDHTIVLGEVVRAEVMDESAEPLLFFGARYRALRPAD